jgi:hypothetical protein
MVVSILLWNTEGNKQSLQVLLEEAKYDILAIQEPWINPQTKSTYCPRSCKYHLVHSLEGRSALYITKDLPTSQWDYEATNEWCWVRLRGEGRGLEVWSIYNPPDSKGVPRALLGRSKPDLPVVLAGDFNLFHPLWDYYGREEQEAEDLLQLALQWGLDLRTPWGTTTREPQGAQRGRPSTIDHFWATEGLYTAYYGIQERGRSDHYPQVLEVDQGPQEEVLAPQGWSWAKMDKRRVEAEAALLPTAIGLTDPGPQSLIAKASTIQGLSQAFDWLVGQLQRIAQASTPPRKPNKGFQAQWWTYEVQQATREAKAAERAYKQAPGDFLRQRLNQSYHAQSTAIRLAQTKAWRSTLQKATTDSSLLWKLERWARTKSFLPTEPPKLPPFQGGPSQPDLTTHDQKAKALAARFFPSPLADLSDIPDTTFDQAFDQPRFEVRKEVTIRDIARALSGIQPWKAPGDDLIPTGLIKACGKPLYQILAILYTRCLELQWYPERFKKAKTVVLTKPGKPPDTYRTPKGYRPIALLPTLGKVLEAILAKRVAEAAEWNGLLPDEQMGNRVSRSTELAVRLVVAQVQEAWRQGAATSLLQLDISGAFDTVNHTRLLDTLRTYGFPGWLVRWIRAWLTSREATLFFDGQTTQPIPIRAGVPQGSPLSPILFILYIASLYRALKEKHPGVAIVGFADDTNLLAFGRGPLANSRQLEEAWKTCLQWAKTRGMVFAGEKSELIHFNKGRKQWSNPVNLAHSTGEGFDTVKPIPSSRFLGVWLDWRLNWKAHREAVERKLKTQDFALCRIAAKTWGPALHRAREVYTKCIRSALAYGASSFHKPTPIGGQPQGIARDLQKAQSRSLRVVAGAYKATPIRSLEAETWVPPLDLYLNKRLADFENRLQKPTLPTPQTSTAPTRYRPPGQLVEEACKKVQSRFQWLGGTRGPTKPLEVEEATEAISAWSAQGRDSEEALKKAWEARWAQEATQRQQRYRARNQALPTVQPTDFRPKIDQRALERHEGLTKAESSLLTQARTGAIGLKDFLFRARVPGIPTPYCNCGQGRETVEHLVVWCPQPPNPRTWSATEIRSQRDLYRALDGPGDRERWLARKVVRWLLHSRRLLEYRLAVRLELD